MAPVNATIEKELEECIKKLKDEAEKFERLQKLRLKGAALERPKKIREDVV